MIVDLASARPAWECRRGRCGAVAQSRLGPRNEVGVRGGDVHSIADFRNLKLAVLLQQQHPQGQGYQDERD
ncbi:MAG: hypothetical protein NZO58_08800, partial [Gemmataceae bacterium]|nr:hypothetical protein [Gemmataceae bacterium]